MFLRLTLFGFLLLLSAGAMSAQENPVPKTVTAGVLNGKATKLVKPEYPAAAKAVKASGAVNVQVTIGEDGSVVSAEAVSGHPLLRTAAVDAAKASTFSPTTLSGIPVKVTGVIVYSFSSGSAPISTTSGGNVDAAAAPRLTTPMIASTVGLAVPARNPNSTNWFLVGWNLSTLESDFIFKNSMTSSPLQRLPTEWTTERGYVEQISKLVGTEVPTPQMEGISKRERIENVSEINALAQSLGNSIYARLTEFAAKQWLYSLGRRMMIVTLDPSFIKPGSRTVAVNEIRALVSIAPTDIPASLVKELTTFADLIEKGSDSRESFSAVLKQRSVVMSAAMSADR